MQEKNAIAKTFSYNQFSLRLPSQSQIKDNDFYLEESQILIQIKSGKKLKLDVDSKYKVAQVKQQLEQCFAFAQKNKTQALFAFLGKGVIRAIKLPFTVTSGVIFTLEKISEKAKQISTHDQVNLKRRNMAKNKINNPASGLIVGTSKMATQMIGALAGVFSEPFKGAKRKGLKGATQGTIIGISGLVFKPLAGTIDLITTTVRGVQNFGGGIYRNIFKIIKKSQPNQIIESEMSNQDMHMIAENDEEILLINKKNNPLDIDNFRRYSTQLQKLDQNQILDENGENDNQEDVNEMCKIINYYQSQQDIYKNEKEQICEFMLIKPRCSEQDNFDENQIDELMPQPNQKQNINISQSFHHIDNAKSQVDLPNIEDQLKISSSQFISKKKINLNINYNSIIPIFLPNKSPFREKSLSNPQTPSSITSFNKNETDNQIINQKFDFNQIDTQNIEKISQNQECNDGKIIINIEQTLPKYCDSSENENNDIQINDYDCFRVFKYLVEIKNYSETEIKEIIEKFNISNQKHEIIRHPMSHKKGGKACPDKNMLKCIRNVGKEMITLIGRKILSGALNLTTIDCPIKLMVPCSALQTALTSSQIYNKFYYYKIIACYFPIYLNLACKEQNLLERIKLCICATISSFYIYNNFAKPVFLNFYSQIHHLQLNPLLGETFQGSYNDGTLLFAEQIQLHPPIIFYYVVGPNNSYQYYGYYNNSASSSLNSFKILNKGRRYFKFPNAQLLQCSYAEEVYQNIFLGETRHETKGNINIEDKQNNIRCTVKIGNVKKFPSDFLEGSIIQDGKIVSKLFGTYMGFIDFDDQRYWDYRWYQPCKMNIIKSSLPSDHNLRRDKFYRKKGNIDIAQKLKSKYDQQEKDDQKLRKQYQSQQQKNPNLKQQF